MRRQTSSWIIYIVFIILMFVVFNVFSDSKSNVAEVSNTQYEKLLEENSIESVKIEQNENVPTGDIIFTASDGSQGKVYVTDTTKAVEKLSNSDVTYT